MHNTRFILIGIAVVVAISACRQLNQEYCDKHWMEDKDCPQGGNPCSATNPDCEPPTPVCNTNKMICVQCTVDNECPPDRHLCDNDVCVACRKNSDCDSNLCIDSACIKSDEIAYVSDAGAPNTVCSQDKPCKTLAQALDVGRKYIKVTGTVEAGVSITDTLALRSYAIYGEPEMSALTRLNDGSVLKVEKGSSVSVSDLSITSNTNKSVGLEIKDANTVVSLSHVSISNQKGATGMDGLGILMSAGTLTANDSQIFQNGNSGVLVVTGAFESNRSSIYRNQGVAGVQVQVGGSFTMRDSKVFENQIGVNVLGGIATINHSWIYDSRGAAGVASATGSTVTIDSSIIARNTGTYGLSLTGTLVIKNNIISANGSPTSTVGVFLLSAPTTFEFNTISDNATSGVDVGVSCAVLGAITNNIITGNVANGCAVTYSLMDMTVPGEGNQTGDPMFVKVIDPLDPGFYRIKPGSAAQNRGKPTATDKDIDGQSRSDGLPDMGADEYVDN